MKSIVLLLVCSTGLFAGDLYQRIQAPYLDVYVDSTQNKQPNIPGMGATEYLVSVSIKTTDYAAAAFYVTLHLKLEDGSTMSCQRHVEKSPFRCARLRAMLHGSSPPTFYH